MHQRAPRETEKNKVKMKSIRNHQHKPPHTHCILFCAATEILGTFCASRAFLFHKIPLNPKQSLQNVVNNTYMELENEH